MDTSIILKLGYVKKLNYTNKKPNDEFKKNICIVTIHHSIGLILVKLRSVSKWTWPNKCSPMARSVIWSKYAIYYLFHKFYPFERRKKNKYWLKRDDVSFIYIYLPWQPASELALKSTWIMYLNYYLQQENPNKQIYYIIYNTTICIFCNFFRNNHTSSIFLYLGQ